MSYEKSPYNGMGHTIARKPKPRKKVVEKGITEKEYTRLQKKSRRTKQCKNWGCVRFRESGERQCALHLNAINVDRLLYGKQKAKLGGLNERPNLMSPWRIKNEQRKAH